MPILSEFAKSLHREAKIAITPIPTGKKWVFLVGCYNSGTTLLAKILGQHPAISALPTEGHFITDQFIKDYEIGLPRMWVDREDLFTLDENSNGPDPYRVIKEWAMRLDTRKPVLLEKSPPNVSKMRWLEKHFKEAYFIGIIRNGYAVAEGITRKGDPQHLASGWPIEKSAYQWKRSNEIMFQNAEQVKRFMLVTYEDVADDPYAELNRITKFLDISGFDAEIRTKKWGIHERNENVRNMNAESIERLDPEDIRKIDNVAGELLQKFGYKPDKTLQ